MAESIIIQGARVHNLKNIDLEIPRNKLVVITGPSGSGKSSLAFDTLYAEGQRRYVESLSAYARQFLERLPKPDVDFISGISPAIAIEQKNRTTSPRSTVGTVTEIYDFLRLLFSRIGHTFCPRCHQEVTKDHPEDAWNWISHLPENSRLYISFPLRSDRIQDWKAEKQHLLNQGFLRVWIHGEIRLLDTVEPEALAQADVRVVVDRIQIHVPLDRARIIDSLETAFEAGEGYLTLFTEEGALRRFNRNFECSQCGLRMLEPEPRLFSFNNPYGACPGCQGFGDMMDIDLNKIVPDRSRTLRDGAIVPWNTPRYRGYYQALLTVARRYKIPINVPFERLDAEALHVILNGIDEFPGIRGFFKRLEKKKYKVHIRVMIARYRSYFTCTMCRGARLRPEALQVKIDGLHIAQLTRMKIDELFQFFQRLQLSSTEARIAEQLLKAIRSRLKYLLDVGLNYLTLDRRANTLSGGEFQRINLATALGSSLTSTLYVLDEPTVGLHPRDTHRLIRILQALRDSGNTVVVVEHDPAVIQAADHLIDLGPGAGEQGGRVVFTGNHAQMLKSGSGLTAAYLREEKQIPARTEFRSGTGRYLTVVGAREHNLKNITVNFPLGMLVCVTGVSGSGKSTLIDDVLYQGIRRSKGQYQGKVGDHDAIRGLHYLSGVEMVDQSPIGRTSRSNPVTYIKAFDEIRKIFAGTPAARARGYTPGHFSFNVPGGRCDVCRGDGELVIDMQFLADVHLICDACKGRRFKPEVLTVHYQGKTIHDVLNMTVDQAMDFFARHPRVTRKLKVLQEVGLGYLRLGQPAPTLSGGEGQRLKLAAHLTRNTHRNFLYLFDEPTTGLHFDDIAKLLRAFDQLIQGGASVIIVEHNLDVIKQADYIIDLGPEGGDRGGEVVAAGTPLEVAQHPTSTTGRFLRSIYEKAGVRVA